MWGARVAPRGTVLIARAQAVCGQVARRAPAARAEHLDGGSLDSFARWCSEGWKWHIYDLWYFGLCEKPGPIESRDFHLSNSISEWVALPLVLLDVLVHDIISHILHVLEDITSSERFVIS